MSGLSNKYSIEIGRWFQIAGAHYSSVLGPMIGYTLILGVIFIVPYLNGLLMLFIGPPLFAGHTIVALAQLKGKRWTFGDFFSGFNYYGPLLGNFWLTLLLALGCMLPGIVVSLIIWLAANALKVPVLSVVIVPIVLANYAAAIYVVTRATCFCMPLIIDRNCGALEAMKASWELSRGHFWGLFGTHLVLGIIAGAGILLCFVGVLFTVPFAIMAQVAGYMLIAGSRPPLELPAGQRRARSSDEDDAQEEG